MTKILRFWRTLPDHRPLAAVGLITPYAGLLAVQQIGQHRAVGDVGRGATTAWISLVRLSMPICAFMPKYHWLPFLVWCFRQTSQADASATLKADAIQGCSASDYVAMFDTDRLDLA